MNADMLTITNQTEITETETETSYDTSDTTVSRSAANQLPQIIKVQQSVILN